MSSAAVPPDVSNRDVRCRCGARYASETFASLVSVLVLDTHQIAPLVVRWPEDTVVDVRACARCATPIARLAIRHAVLV
jgi:hypothetical protein